MAQMPRGAPRSVPDPAGEAYDTHMAGRRASAATGPLEAFQSARPIPRPNTAQTLIPIIGPTWEAAADLQDGNYGGAAFNASMAILEAVPGGVVAARGARAARLGIDLMNTGSRTAASSSRVLRQAGLAGPGQEIHHTVRLNGLGRNTPDPRNDYMFLKVLPKEQHRRLTGSWAGKPRYDPVRRVWYGTTDWMKAVPITGAAVAADTAENVANTRERR